MSGCCRGALKKPGKQETSVILHLSRSVKPLRVLDVETTVHISHDLVRLRLVCIVVCVYVCISRLRVSSYSIFLISHNKMMIKSSLQYLFNPRL
jgi:hypothetical protein